MNKLSLIVICLFLFAALPVSAGPFLVCDPPPPGENVDLYGLELNGNSITLQPDPTGQYGFKYDLAGQQNGPYIVKAKAHNSVGWSGWSATLNFNLPHK
jgi:hypothetical protein